MGMKGIWVVPILASILILGTMGIQDVYGPQVKGLKEKVHFPAVHMTFSELSDGSPIAGADCEIEVSEGGLNSKVHKAPKPTNKHGNTVVPSFWTDFDFPITIQGFCSIDGVSISSDPERVADDGSFSFQIDVQR